MFQASFLAPCPFFSDVLQCRTPGRVLCNVWESPRLEQLGPGAPVWDPLHYGPVPFRSSSARTALVASGHPSSTPRACVSRAASPASSQGHLACCLLQLLVRLSGAWLRTSVSLSTAQHGDWERALHQRLGFQSCTRCCPPLSPSCGSGRAPVPPHGRQARRVKRGHSRLAQRGTAYVSPYQCTIVNCNSLLFCSLLTSRELSY